MLHLLVQYARDHHLVTESGFKPKQVRWAIICDTEGKFLHIAELGDTEQKRNSGQTFSQCPDLSQPEMKRGGQGCRHFLVDTAEVIALYGKNIDDPKLLAKHTYFVELLQKASVTLPELGFVAEMLKTPEALGQIRESLIEKNAKPTDNATFAVLNREPMYLVEDAVWHEWWRSFRQALSGKSRALEVGKKRKANGTKDAISSGVLMRCLASGELVKPTPTHPKIEGLSDVGGLSMGDVLASFKQDAFRSYGLSQSSNAAVSEEMAAIYRAALNRLIRYHSRRLAGTKVVHWYTGELSPEDDPMNILDQGLSFLEEYADKEQKESDAQYRAQQLLDGPSTGNRSELLNYRYYVLILSGASGRVMVRDWMEGQFGELATNIQAWFDHLKVVRRDGNGIAPMPKFMAVLGGLVRELKDLSPPLVTKMWHVAVKKESIPQYVMAQALARGKIDIMNDTPANHARMGLIKAYHLRKGDCFMGPYLNEEHPHPAYHCGRLMAVLADLQYAALGDVGAGIVQRYYAAASSTPALILGSLTRTSHFHLNKLDKGLAHWYEERIAGIWARIRDSVPKTLTLEEQSLFALGYYQQKAARKTRPEQVETNN